MTKFSARTLHGIADDLGCAPELVAAIAAETKVRSKASLIDEIRGRLSHTDATPEAHGIDDAGSAPDAPSLDEAPKEKAPAKPGLTLSQRRALLRGLDGPVTPGSAFRALPFDYLASVGYATRGDEGAYTLTDAGVARAESINPGYLVWSAGESVAADPTRPAAGTHRYAKAAVEAVGHEAVAEPTA